MATYLIYRKGSSNTFNTLGPRRLIEAKNRVEALAEAERQLSAYNGQYLDAVAASRAPRADYQVAQELDALSATYGEPLGSD